MSAAATVPAGPSVFSNPPSPTPSGNSPNDSSSSSSGNPTANATLYLYTFLATLVLLLAVSSAIVVRSLILRRRHQRLVEEAIRTGTWLPHHFNSTSRRRRDIGQKPTLWEAWLHTHNDDGEGEECEKRHWSRILPVYAAYVNPSTPLSQEPTSSAENSGEPPASRSPRFIRHFTRRRSPPSPQPATGALPAAGQMPASPSSPTVTPTPTVRVAVLIAMPDASRRQHGDEKELPVVEIGIVDVNLKGDETETPSRDASS